MVRSLTYTELLKRDGMEEEADIFALYLPSLRVAMGIKQTSGIIYDSIKYLTHVCIIRSS